jgi:hypothetical protein
MSSDEITCPFCGSGNGCDHHLASIDLGECEIYAGYLDAIGPNWSEEPIRLDDPIREVFLSAFSQKLKKLPFEDSPELMKLWKNSRIRPADPDEPIIILGAILASFLVARLGKAGSICINNRVDQLWSSIEVCELFAENPKEVVCRYFSSLKSELGLV